MKRIIISLIKVTLCLLLAGTHTIKAEDELTTTVSHVYARFGDEDQKDVLYSVMEIDSDIIGELQFQVKMFEEGNYSYRLIQYDAGNDKRYDIGSFATDDFSINTAELKSGIPLYLCAFDPNGNCVAKRLLTIRVQKGLASEMFPEEIGSQYDEPIEIDMDEMLPGMKFSMDPYLIPCTAKTYTDGRFVIGLGLNSINTSFWKDAYNGKIGPGATPGDLEKAFWGDSKKKGAVTGSNLGLVFDVSGYLQGNSYKKDPLEGELNVFIGTGFAASGQYSILTFDVSAIGGFNGVMDFELQFNEERSKYTDFVVERFGIGFKDSLELYGGLGLSSLASVGIYGAGSLSGYTWFYPETLLDSLILAGECGFKVKLFSRTLFSFALVSGSHEFVRKTGDGLLNFSMQDQLDDILLAQDYASVVGDIHEPGSSGQWYTDGDDPDQTSSLSLQGFEDDKDFAHLLASDIYPDNRLQIVDTTVANLPRTNVVFLGSDASRANGNRSRLMNFYFDEDHDFISDPDWIGDDDGTADFDPYTARLSNNGVYLVWRNGLKAFDQNASIEEIATNTDLYLASYQTGRAWYSGVKVTDYAGSDVFASGAKVFEDAEGRPTVSYYLNSTSDPLALDPQGSHMICAARQNEEGNWVNEELFELTGRLNELDAAVFSNSESYAVSYSVGNDDTLNKIALIQDGKTILERNDAINARFVPMGNNYQMLTWWENGRLYGLSGSGDEIRALTPEDLRIPSGDYKIYGRFGSGKVVIMGTRSKDSSENLYAVFSLDGGNHWTKSDLTDIPQYASVNESALAFTKADEPILFYSVQNYELNFKEERLHAENYLQALGNELPVLSSAAPLLGDNDDRFTDTQTDLYVKARNANRHLKIDSAAFKDTDNARKGHDLPFTLTITNNGLCPIDSCTLYVDGSPVRELSADIGPGETTQIDTTLYLAEDAEDKDLTFDIGVSSVKEQIEDHEQLILDGGHISVVYDHEFIYGREILHYSVKNNGFSTKKVQIKVYDEDSGELVRDYALVIPGGHTQNDSYSAMEGTWLNNGHKNLKAYVLMEGETIEDLDSTRIVSFKSLENIYLQDNSDLLKDPEKNDNAAKEELLTSYRIPMTGVENREPIWINEKEVGKLK